MKVRNYLLLGCAAGALGLCAGPTSQALAADALVAKAEPAAAPTWWTHGFVEVGGRFFLNDPSHRSLGKFYEYRDLRPGPTGDMFIAAGTTDGLYRADFWANNIGYEDQSYFLSLQKAGEHYLDLGWDQTPHVYSHDARTLYNGVGTNVLTIPSGVRATLQGPGLPGTLPPTPTAGTVAYVNGQSKDIDVKIRRDTASVNYRWTPEEAWDFRADYSHMHREGTQIVAATSYVGNGTNAVAGNAGTRVPLELPRPVDDTTQRGNLSGEYAGTSPWGKKYNVAVGYGFSLYSNDFDSFTFQNPWVADGRNSNNNVLDNRYSLDPSNSAQFLSMHGGMDLPLQSRYIGAFQYSLMRQNDTFLPFTSNPSNVARPTPSITQNGVPITSLNGETNTILANNVITTQITKDIKSTIRYRYYDFDNGGDPITVTNWVNADNTNDRATGVVQPVSYTKQNASADLTWRAAKWMTVGTGYAWERWDRDRRDTNVTDEHLGKVFVDLKPIDWTRMRASLQYSERRYDQYVDALPTNVNALTMRMFDQANRNRTKGNFYVDLFGANNVTVTPTAGFRLDDYGTNPFAPSLEYGLVTDNSWNAGVELAWAPSREFSVFASYLHEDAYRQTYTGASATGARQNQEMRDSINTFVAGMNWIIVPAKFDVKLTGTYSFANQAWWAAQGPSTQALTQPSFPDTKNTFSRVDMIARYILDPDLMTRMGWKGESYVKFRYTWERNDVSDWQVIDPQLTWVFNGTANSSGIYGVMMQWDHPNYNVHMVAMSLGVKW